MKRPKTVRRRHQRKRERENRRKVGGNKDHGGTKGGDGLRQGRLGWTDPLTRWVRGRK